MVLLSENDLFILQEVLLVLKGITFPVELFSPGIAESISIAALLFDKQLFTSSLSLSYGGASLLMLLLRQQLIHISI